MQASFHITIYKERGTVSMKKYVVIIDLHCDPTIPSGSGDSGGGNAYSRSLLQELQKIMYITFTLPERNIPIWKNIFK